VITGTLPLNNAEKKLLPLPINVDWVVQYLQPPMFRRITVDSVATLIGDDDGSVFAKKNSKIK
jgi:hypothetical protein